MPRPKKFASDAERKAAYRAANSRIDLVIPNDLNLTIDAISDQLAISKNELVTAMIKYALTNHNWKVSGVWTRPK